MLRMLPVKKRSQSTGVLLFVTGCDNWCHKNEQKKPAGRMRVNWENL